MAECKYKNKCKSIKTCPLGERFLNDMRHNCTDKEYKDIIKMCVEDTWIYQDDHMLDYYHHMYKTRRNQT